MIAQNGVSRYPRPMPKTTRLRALQAILRKKKIPALLVTDPLNVRYLSGLKATEAMLLVRQRDATLIVDGRYVEVARRLRSKGLGIADRGDLPKLFSRIRRCGFEGHHVTVERFARWKALFKSTKFVQELGLVEGLRRKKDSSEKSAMKRALAVTNAVIAMIPDFLDVGVTEKQVANRILGAMLDLGADGLAFEAIVAFGKNSSLPHHRAGAAKLRRNDIVQIDVGAKVDGYCADRSEVFFVGTTTDEQRRAYDSVRECLRAVKRAAKAGASYKALDELARGLLAESGFPPYPHALGHGVGLDVHEGVVLAARSKEKLLSGEAIALEPGVYFESKFGIRLEDTVFVK